MLKQVQHDSFGWAFGASDAADAVPMDQLVVTAGRPAAALMLPPAVAVRYATQDAGK